MMIVNIHNVSNIITGINLYFIEEIYDAVLHFVTSDLCHVFFRYTVIQATLYGDVALISILKL